MKRLIAVRCGFGCGSFLRLNIAQYYHLILQKATFFQSGNKSSILLIFGKYNILNNIVSYEQRIPLAALIHKRIYRIHSRNLIVGVWNEETNGFIGIRNKFGNDYLFTEYEYDTNGKYGTAWAIELVDAKLSDNVLLAETLGTKSGTRWVKFTSPISSGGRGWVYVDDDSNVEDTNSIISLPNTELLDILKPYHEKFLTQKVEEDLKEAEIFRGLSQTPEYIAAQEETKRRRILLGRNAMNLDVILRDKFFYEMTVEEANLFLKTFD